MEAGTKKENKIATWWSGLKSEFGKITWPDRKTLTRQTVAVVVVCLIMGLIIAILDAGLAQGVQWLVNL